MNLPAHKMRNPRKLYKLYNGNVIVIGIETLIVNSWYITLKDFPSLQISDDSKYSNSSQKNMSGHNFHSYIFAYKIIFL